MAGPKSPEAGGFEHGEDDLRRQQELGAELAREVEARAGRSPDEAEQSAAHDLKLPKIDIRGDDQGAREAARLALREFIAVHEADTDPYARQLVLRATEQVEQLTATIEAKEAAERAGDPPELETFPDPPERPQFESLARLDIYELEQLERDMGGYLDANHSQAMVQEGRYPEWRDHDNSLDSDWARYMSPLHREIRLVRIDRERVRRELAERRRVAVEAAIPRSPRYDPKLMDDPMEVARALQELEDYTIRQKAAAAAATSPRPPHGSAFAAQEYGIAVAQMRELETRLKRLRAGRSADGLLKRVGNQLWGRNKSGAAPAEPPAEPVVPPELPSESAPVSPLPFEHPRPVPPPRLPERARRRDGVPLPADAVPGEISRSRPSAEDSSDSLFGPPPRIVPSRRGLFRRRRPPEWAPIDRATAFRGAPYLLRGGSPPDRPAPPGNPWGGDADIAWSNEPTEPLPAVPAPDRWPASSPVGPGPEARPGPVVDVVREAWSPLDTEHPPVSGPSEAPRPPRAPEVPTVVVAAGEPAPPMTELEAAMARLNVTRANQVAAQNRVRDDTTPYFYQQPTAPASAGAHGETLPVHPVASEGLAGPTPIHANEPQNLTPRQRRHRGLDDEPGVAVLPPPPGRRRPASEPHPEPVPGTGHGAAASEGGHGGDEHGDDGHHGNPLYKVPYGHPRKSLPPVSEHGPGPQSFKEWMNFIVLHTPFFRGMIGNRRVQDGGLSLTSYWTDPRDVRPAPVGTINNHVDPDGDFRGGMRHVGINIPPSADRIPKRPVREQGGQGDRPAGHTPEPVERSEAPRRPWPRLEPPELKPIGRTALPVAESARIEDAILRADFTEATEHIAAIPNLRMRLEGLRRLQESALYISRQYPDTPVRLRTRGRLWRRPRVDAVRFLDDAVAKAEKAVREARA